MTNIHSFISYLWIQLQKVYPKTLALVGNHVRHGAEIIVNLRKKIVKSIFIFALNRPAIKLANFMTLSNTVFLRNRVLT